MTTPRAPLLVCLMLSWAGALSLQSVAARPAGSPPRSAGPTRQDGLPDAPGRALVERVCGSCHGMAYTTETDRSVPEWRDVIELMKAYGAVATDEEWTAIATYVLTQLAYLHVNTAPARDVAVFFALDAQTAEAVVAYRDQRGGFTAVEDVKNAPGMNADGVEAVKDRLVF